MIPCVVGIAAVLREHQRCTPQCTPELLAAEIDKALGGLRRTTATGVLTEEGFLITAYWGSFDQPKTYAKWVTGWTENQ